MKMLHVIGSLNKKLGGPIALIISICPLMAAAGVPVEVACLDASGDDVEGADATHFLGPGWGKFGSAPYQYSRRFDSWLEENVSRFDAVLIHGIWQYHSWAVQRACRAAGVPYLVYIHGALDPWFKRYYPLKHLKKWPYWLLVEHRVLRDASAVLFTCEEEERLARNAFWPYKVNAELVTCGIADVPQNRDELAGEFIRKFPSLANKEVFLFLSRIDQKKGCDDLIAAFAVECYDVPDAVLVIAGHDSSEYAQFLKREVCRHGIEDRVMWVGMLEGTMKWGAFVASSVFCLPSHSENYGIAVVEALACGVPVLISDKVNIFHEILAADACIVEPDGLTGAKRMLRRWKETPHDRRAILRANARQCFLRTFESSQGVNKMIEVASRFARKDARMAGGA